MQSSSALPRRPTASGRGPKLFRIAPDVHGLRTWIVNAYFYGRPGSHRSEPWVLVDAGMPGAQRQVLAAAETLFGDRPPSAVVLTHGHFDHVGALAAMVERWQVPIYAHARELPFLGEGEAYPPPDPSVGGVMARMSPTFPRKWTQLPQQVRPLPADGSVPEMPGWRWLATPGHSPGHVSIFRDDDHCLIAGDAFVTVRQELLRAVAAQRPEVRPPPAYYTVDWRAAFNSIRRLAELEPEVAATGHGRPMHGPRMREQLRALINDFERRGLPARGRYVDQTWPRPMGRATVS